MRLEELNLSYIGISEIVDLASAIATLRKGDAQNEASRIARDKLQLARDKFEHDRKPPAPRRSPTKEEIEEIEPAIRDAQALGYTAIGWKAARSLHSGGVHMLLCDGSTRFVAENINVNVWRGLGTRAGGEVLGEF